MNIKVLISINKPYPVPDDPAYLPVYVGKYGRTLAAEKSAAGTDGSDGRTEGAAGTVTSPQAGAAARSEGASDVIRHDAAGRPYAFDHTGDNISDKNPYYCELTALYWAWKNLDPKEAEYLGLVHYRRYFRGHYWWRKESTNILGNREMEQLFREADLILPSKRRYGIETIESHFRHTHEPEALDLTRDIIREKYPDYIPTFDKVLRRRSAHMFNMMIARRSVADEYCAWLFDILDELENRLDITGYSDFEARVFGRIAEMLLDVWVAHNRVAYTEVPFVFLEDTNWPRKITRFLMAKYFNRKYKDNL